jgi:hypothetical protein
MDSEERAFLGGNSQTKDRHVFLSARSSLTVWIHSGLPEVFLKEKGFFPALICFEIRMVSLDWIAQGGYTAIKSLPCG